MEEAVDAARENVGDPAFDVDARRRYWARFWQNFLAGIALFVLAIVSFPLVNPLGAVAAVTGSGAIALVAVYFWSKCWTCAACGGRYVRHLPIYCPQCGETYLFHRAGRWLFERRRAGIEKWVRAELERKYWHERRLLVAADKQLSGKESVSPEDAMRLNEILDALDEAKSPK